MSYTIQIIRAAPSEDGAPPRAMSERYDTVEDAVRAADTEMAMIGVPGAVTYRILDEAGQPVPLAGNTLS